MLPNLVATMKVNKNVQMKHNRNYIDKIKINFPFFDKMTFHLFCFNSDDVIQRANDVPYGLCASIWTENSGRIHRVASKLKVRHQLINNFVF